MQVPVCMMGTPCHSRPRPQRLLHSMCGPIDGAAGCPDAAQAERWRVLYMSHPACKHWDTCLFCAACVPSIVPHQVACDCTVYADDKAPSMQHSKGNHMTTLGVSPRRWRRVWLEWCRSMLSCGICQKCAMWPTSLAGHQPGARQNGLVHSLLGEGTPLAGRSQAQPQTSAVSRARTSCLQVPVAKFGIARQRAT